MLRVSLNRAESPGCWRLDGQSWRSAAGCVAPYDHPSLEAFARASSTRTLFVVREKLATRPRESWRPPQPADEPAIDSLLTSMCRWPLDYVTLEIPVSQGPVVFKAGRWGTAPIYLVSTRRGLEADWDPARLYPYLPQNIDFQRAVLCLVNLGYPYSRRTLFPQMWHLTERATAVWQPETSALEVVYPAALSWPRARRLRPGADVLGAFERVMSRALGRWFDVQREKIAVELSGGLDSTTAAIVAAKMSPFPVRSYGMIMPDDNGRYQSARRNEVMAAHPMNDVTIQGADFLPFAPPSRRLSNGDVVPWGEYYEELVGALLARMHSDGVRTVVTGMGGDEISTLRESELYTEVEASSVQSVEPLPDENNDDLPEFLTARAREAFHDFSNLDEAPSGHIEASCYESAQAGSPVYLRAGIWPASPYCDPDLVELVRILPFEWRDERRLQREYLRAAGCSDAVTHPAVTESFRPLMVRALRVDAVKPIREIFQTSRLADLGLVDRDALLTSYDAFVATGDAGREDWFMEAVVMETTIRALSG
jgi:asparagine synthase (glutamine-hydrolysing)